MVIETEPNDIKERLSIAYVTAIAARAGCQISKLDIDKQSIDATVRPIRGRKISIDLQLKATSKGCIKDDEVVFELPVNNYNNLRDTECTAPHYLVVLVLDQNDGVWLFNDQASLIIRRCAYWLNLRGAAATLNKETITVKIPCSQIFDVNALQSLMSDAYEMIGWKGGVR